MVQKNINAKRKDSGFTIVELLVVIVVIAILAAITIVAYTNVTTKAKASQAQSNGSSIQNVAESYNADAGYYPPTIASFGTGYTGGGNVPSAVKPTTITVLAGQTGTGAVPAGTQNLTANNGTSNITYSCLTSCTNPTGGRIGYWDYNTGAVAHIYVGAATAGAGSTYVIAGL